MALDTLRTAVWSPSDVPLDRPGGGSLGGGIALFALNFIIGGFVLGPVKIYAQIYLQAPAE